MSDDWDTQDTDLQMDAEAGQLDKLIDSALDELTAEQASVLLKPLDYETLPTE